jgi:hypothetical protein
MRWCQVVSQVSDAIVVEGLEKSDGARRAIAGISVVRPCGRAHPAAMVELPLSCKAAEISSSRSRMGEKCGQPPRAITLALISSSWVPVRSSSYPRPVLNWVVPEAIPQSVEHGDSAGRPLGLGEDTRLRML